MKGLLLRGTDSAKMHMEKTVDIWMQNMATWNFWNVMEPDTSLLSLDIFASKTEVSFQ